LKKIIYFRQFSDYQKCQRRKTTLDCADPSAEVTMLAKREQV